MIGSEVPRLWTEPLRDLTPATSRGFEAADFAEKVLGITLFPWQRWLLVHALELLEDGTFRFRTLVVLVARQNGKTTLMQILALWRMYVDGAPLVIGTAQNLDVAEESWQGAVDMAEGVPDLKAEIIHVDRSNGKKQIRLVSGERYKVAAANRRGGRGLSGDLVMLDELREHQTWAAWGAVTKTTMARARAQILCLSNAGDANSVVLASLRSRALDVLGGKSSDADDGSLGLFEWSAPDGCALDDPEGWAAANPALGHRNGVSVQAIRAALATDPEGVFRTEVLCQWVESVENVFDLERWEALADPGSQILTPVLAVDMTPGRDWCSIGAAGLDGDLLRLELVEHRPGSMWVVDRVAGISLKNGCQVGVDPGSPAGSLAEPLRQRGVPVVEIPLRAYTQACGALFDGVVAGSIRHRPDPDLDAAVAGCRKRTVGEAWAWDRKGAAVISPLVAVTLAGHLAKAAHPFFAASAR